MCSCAKLDNTYLPPPDAQNSGGNFGLAPPNQGSNGNNGNNGFNNGNNGNNGFNNGNNGNNGNFGGAPQNGFGQNPPQQQGFQPQESQQPPIAILSYENEPNYGDGSYKYSYETGMCVQEIYKLTFIALQTTAKLCVVHRDVVFPSKLPLLQ